MTFPTCQSPPHTNFGAIRSRNVVSYTGLVRPFRSQLNPTFSGLVKITLQSPTKSAWPLKNPTKWAKSALKVSLNPLFWLKDFKNSSSYDLCNKTFRISHIPPKYFFSLTGRNTDCLKQKARNITLYSTAN